MTQASEEQDTPPWVHPSSECEDGAKLGPGTRVWRFCHVQSGAQVGRGVSLGQGCFVAATAVIGDYCRLQNHVSVFDGVTLEEYVFCGPGACFTNVTLPRVEFPVRGNYVATRVRRGASLGANCTIIAGVSVGRYALVGAGAVVTHDVPDFALVVGTPARVVGWCSRSGEKLTFASDGYARSGTELYLLRAGVVELVTNAAS